MKTSRTASLESNFTSSYKRVYEHLLDVSYTIDLRPVSRGSNIITSRGDIS